MSVLRASSTTPGSWTEDVTDQSKVGYKDALLRDMVPQPWLPCEADKVAKTVKLRMGSIDCTTGPNPKIIANGYNVFAEMANDRPALYVVTDQTAAMASSPLWDATKNALRIEGTNRISVIKKRYVVFTGGAKDIDTGTVKIDCTWEIKVWYDGFVESEVTFHARAGAEYTIRYMWIEGKFNHEQLPMFRAPYGGGAGAQIGRMETVDGFSYDETAFVDANIKKTPIWNSSRAYVVGEHVYHLGKTYVSIQNGTNQNPTTATAYWTLTTAKHVLPRPYDFELANLNFPTTVTKAHLWAASAARNDAAGVGGGVGVSTTLYRPPTLQGNAYSRVGSDINNAAAVDPGNNDNEGGLQKPCFSFYQCGEGDKNAHLDKGFWFGLESEFNHRNGKVIWGDGARQPKFHFFFDDAGTKTATFRIDIIGTTGAESNPTAWTESYPNGKYMHDENNGGGGVCYKASTNKPLKFTWFWHSMPCRPRHSVDWRHARFNSRWTVEAVNYGSGLYANQLPSQLGHRKLSKYPMIALLWNSLEWVRRGFILPDHEIFDQHVTAASADAVYAGWAQHWRNPAKDVGGKMMPNVTLLAAVNFMSNEAGFWPPTVGGSHQHRRYPSSPMLDPVSMFEMMRLDRGKLFTRAAEVDADFSQTNLPVGIEINWGNPTFRKYLLEEVDHSLQHPEIGAIYYDNNELIRMDHPDTDPYRYIDKDTFDFGVSGSSGLAKWDGSNTGRTYTRVNAEIGVISGADAWGCVHTIWPIRQMRETQMELYLLHEAYGKPLVSHPFGDLTPPLHSHCHYVVLGEELTGMLGVGSDDFSRPPGTSAFSVMADPYGAAPASYWQGCWAVGCAPLLLPQFNRHTGDHTGAWPSGVYRAQAHNVAAWDGLLAKLDQYEIGLANLSPFTITTPWVSDGSKAYVVDEGIAYNNRVYICKQAHTSPARNPATETAYWLDAGPNDLPAATIADWYDASWRS
jgi:hypothetical protein